ncbi:MAG: DNA alkylation response protein [Alphaproteobacteria bacterium BRH_c36]|nr:MAG: DNA alkylation response protein [Alphaproteobacteria bacterium BRH_c36]
MTNPFSTHTVTNQPPPFEDVNLYASDAALQDAVTREGGGHAARSLVAFGLVCGSSDAGERARLANENPPRLETHDHQGRRTDVVHYHPAYHELMEISCAEGLNCASWLNLVKKADESAADQQVARAAGFYLACQMEPGHLCPVSMTHASVPTLLLQPEIAENWLPKVVTRSYDARREPADTKRAVTIGMGMTEKQGGSDVLANTTSAESAGGGTGGAGCEYLLTGHKWFLSAPMSDAFLMLAQTKAGPGCFLVPRLLPDGTRNELALQRLKSKLGNRSNATAEVELQCAHGWLIGEPGNGVASIIEMVTQTRLDCAVSSAAMMRHALAQAIHHVEHRSAFGRKLVEQPLMIQVLADLALDVEAATALVFRLARSFDRRQDEHASAWQRLMTPVTKYWTTKIAPQLIYEAMECMGGNAYVEELPMARLYREAPVNAIWEGSGNVLALDVLRVLQREPDVARVVMDDLADAVGGDPHLKAALSRIESILHEPRLLDARARALVEGLAALAAGTILRSHAPSAVADAFIATRLGSLNRQTYGQGVDWADTAAILQRASPNR